MSICGGREALPFAAHLARLTSIWRPGRAPWEFEPLTAPPWLCDEIEKLIAEHGGGAVHGIPTPDRPDLRRPHQDHFRHRHHRWARTLHARPDLGGCVTGFKAED